jgi:acetyl/propionyl-CoA carboxylase alpha subunit
VAAGFEVPVFYDSLIAKLVAWAETRPGAIARLRRALDEYRVVGVTTTVPFFQWLLEQPAFIDGRVDTTYLDQVLVDRAGRPFVEPDGADEHQATVAVAIGSWLRAHRAAAGTPSASEGTWRRAARLDGLR